MDATPVETGEVIAAEVVAAMVDIPVGVKTEVALLPLLSEDAVEIETGTVPFALAVSESEIPLADEEISVTLALVADKLVADKVGVTLKVELGPVGVTIVAFPMSVLDPVPVNPVADDEIAVPTDDGDAVERVVRPVALEVGISVPDEVETPVADTSVPETPVALEDGEAVAMVTTEPEVDGSEIVVLAEAVGRVTTVELGSRMLDKMLPRPVESELVDVGTAEERVGVGVITPVDPTPVYPSVAEDVVALSATLEVEVGKSVMLDKIEERISEMLAVLVGVALSETEDALVVGASVSVSIALELDEETISVALELETSVTLAMMEDKMLEAVDVGISVMLAINEEIMFEEVALETSVALAEDTLSGALELEASVALADDTTSEAVELGVMLESVALATPVPVPGPVIPARELELVGLGVAVAEIEESKLLSTELKESVAVDEPEVPVDPPVPE